MWGRVTILVLFASLLLASCGPKPSEAPAATATQPPAQVAATEPVEGCPVVLGEWRDERPYWLNITRICQTGTGDRIVHITFYNDSNFSVSALDSQGATGSSSGDAYTVNEDGTLTISDNEGPIITLEPF